MLSAAMADNRHADEHRSQQEENVCLDNAEEYFKKIQSRRDDHRYQRTDNRKQQRSGKDIAEQSEAKREDLGKLQDQLQETDGKVNQTEYAAADQFPERKNLEKYPGPSAIVP